jgi:altronate hydrolase
MGVPAGKMEGSMIAENTFLGIPRGPGRAGTRNYIGVFVMVNCAATVARKVAEHFDEDRLAAYPNVDGVVPFIHELGCGMEMTGEPMDLLRRTIGGMVRNPNIGAALVLALGCERNNIYGFLEQEKLTPGPLLRTLVMQEKGGTAKTVELGIAAIEEMLPLVNDVRRVPMPASHLTLGIQSASLDEAAGRSANPALGVAVDLLVAAGGTAIVSATNELRGVEGELLARAASPAVGEKLQQRIQWWRESRARPGDSAVTPERAQAAARRWGNAPLAEVYRYAEPVTQRGLVFMDSPAYEAMSATGQMAGGANVICLTTGRGSGYGALPAPTLKIASNSEAFRRMQDDIDINGGEVLDGSASVEEMGQRIYADILRVASGEPTKAEELGLGENEFVPWPIGVFS